MVFFLTGLVVSGRYWSSSFGLAIVLLPLVLQISNFIFLKIQHVLLRFVKAYDHKVHLCSLDATPVFAQVRCILGGTSKRRHVP